MLFPPVFDNYHCLLIGGSDLTYSTTQLLPKFIKTTPLEVQTKCHVGEWKYAVRYGDIHNIRPPNKTPYSSGNAHASSHCD